MTSRRSYQQLKAELAEANRTIRELELENEALKDRLDEIAGIVTEDEDEGDEDEVEPVEVKN